MSGLKEIEKKLIHRLAVVLSVDDSKIKPELPLHTLGVDSLSFVELLVLKEKQLNEK